MPAACVLVIDEELFDALLIVLGSFCYEKHLSCISSAQSFKWLSVLSF